MANKANLRDWVYAAVRDAGGKATIVDVAKHIWLHHEAELKASASLFYTWQYDMRWAAQDLRRSDRVASIAASEKGYWEIKS